MLNWVKCRTIPGFSLENSRKRRNESIRPASKLMRSMHNSTKKGFFALKGAMGEVRKAILFILFAGIALFVSTCAKREPVEEGRCSLEFKTVEEHDEDVLLLATQYLTRTTDKPFKLKDLPNELTADVVFFLAELAGKNTPIVLCSYSNLEHSSLYVDTNGDGRLSDEKPYSPEIKAQSRYNRTEYSFGPISVTLGEPERKLETRFYAKTYDGQLLIVYPAGYQVGNIRLDTKTYKVAIIDGNFDGKYDKIFSPPVEDFYKPKCDLLAFDLNRDNRLKWGHLEVMPLAGMLKIGDAYYNLQVSADGSSIEQFKRVQPEFGTLDLGGAEVNSPRLWSDASVQALSNPPKRNSQLPAGRYMASPIVLTHVDDSGNRWTFRSSQEVGTLKDFEIKADQTTAFRMGPPFSIKTSLEQKDGNALIGVGLQGQAGMLYNPGAQKDRKRIPAPTFKVIDESGKGLTLGQFKYG